MGQREANAFKEEKVCMVLGGLERQQCALYAVSFPPPPTDVSQEEECNSVPEGLDGGSFA